MMKKTKLCTSLMIAFGSGVVALPALAQQTLERVEITCSSIKRIDAETALPVTVIRVEELTRQGITTAEQALSRIAANQSNFGVSQAVGGTTGAKAEADLRGLSGPIGSNSNKTLVLLNGRRLANHAFDAAAVDLNAIPLNAIDRIEILRDGASAIYGTDAIAGVVNVRFLQRFDGTLVSFGYGNTTDTDTREFRGNVISGFTDEKRGVEVVAVADYFDREALFQTDRYFSRSIDQRRQGGSSFLSSVSNPGTIFDPATGDPLRVPANSDGTPAVSEFQPGRNRFDRAPFQPLVPETERYGLSLRGKV